MIKKHTLASRREFMNRLIGAAGAFPAAGLQAQVRRKSRAGSASRINLPKPRVYFNDDANVLVYAPFPLKPDDLSNYIKIYATSAVDMFSWDVVVNGVCWYGSQAGPGIFQGRKEFLDFEAVNLVNNIRSLVQANANPPALVADVCHRFGMMMLASFRTGLGIPTEKELHSGGSVYYNPGAAKLRDMTIKKFPPVDQWYTGGAGEYMLPLDWSHPEVRQLLLAPIQEVAEQFDVDGIELNHIRGLIYFDADQATRKAPIMTDFVRQVRQILNQAAKKRGRDHLLLCTRVPDDLSVCQRFGLDVEEWVKQELVDIVMPSQIHGINFDAPVEDFDRICRGHGCLVLPTIQPGMPPFVYSQFNDFDHQAYTLPQLRALVESWYKRGASGISTFNYQHRRSDIVPWEESMLWLEMLGDSALVERGERVWPMFGVSLSFGGDEVDVRKTLTAPRYAIAIQHTRRHPVKLRFKAVNWTADDVMELDVDGIRIRNVRAKFNISRVHQGWLTGHFNRPQEGEISLFPAFTIEAPLPHLQPSSTIGIRLAKRGHLLSKITIKDITLVSP